MVNTRAASSRQTNNPLQNQGEIDTGTSQPPPAAPITQAQFAALTEQIAILSNLVNELRQERGQNVQRSGPRREAPARVPARGRIRRPTKDNEESRDMQLSFEEQNSAKTERYRNSIWNRLEEKLEECLEGMAKKPKVPSFEEEVEQVSRTPFTREILDEQVPSKFKMPTIQPYDGRSDPLDHLEAFQSLLQLQNASDATLCKAFSSTLKEAARTWYKSLKPNSIGSFKELSLQFTQHFVSSKKVKRTSTYLMNIKQRRDESLRAYMNRFNTEALKVRDLDPQVAIAAVMHGLRNRDFNFSLNKTPPKTFAELLSRAEKYINAEEAGKAKEEIKFKDDESEEEQKK